MSRKKKKEEKREQLAIKDFFDRVLPGVLKFYSDHYICGDSYRCVWAIKEYPPSTEEQAILRQLADRTHVTLRIYNRLVDHAEQHRIIQNANRRNRLRFGGDDIQEMVDAEHNLKDVKQLLTNLRTNGETLLHTAVFIELKAADMDKLRELQSDVMMELTRCKISVDRLTLRQLDGFLSVLPFGYNHFGSQYERVLPASSVANLYPFNYSGKTDPHGFYLGRDKFGTNILTDFDRRSDDKTNANVLILGNSGQGKSHLLKGIWPTSGNPENPSSFWTRSRSTKNCVRTWAAATWITSPGSTLSIRCSPRIGTKTRSTRTMNAPRSSVTLHPYRVFQ